MARKRKHDEDGSQSQPNLQQSSQAQRQTPKRSVASIGDDDRAEYPNLATSENAGSSRRKKPASSRIGRACDRCQHRKLACDPAPEGCQPCQRVNAWCTVTDPLTGTPTYRGQFEYLEQRVAKQNRDIRELLARLRAFGDDAPGLGDDGNAEADKHQAWTELVATGDVKPWERDERQGVPQPAGNPQEEAKGKVENQSEAAPERSQDLRLPVDVPNDSVNGTLSLPDVRTGIAQRRYMGVAHGVDPSRSNPGYRLNMLGWEVDLTAFVPSGNTEGEFGPLPDFDHPLYDRSYRSFVATTYGLQPRIQRPALPSREQAFHYATIFLHGHNAFMPILRGPWVINLLTRVYDEPEYKLSDAAEVCLHIMFAIVIHNLGLRLYDNSQFPRDMANKSYEHYHHAIGYIPKLMIENTLEAMQALVMIANHVREFPLPELGWLVATATFNRLVKLNYHRSPSSGQPWAAGKSFLEIEMRKRVFWSAMMILIPVAGRLGRPMPVRFQDFDVEIPLAIDDQQVVATGVGDPKQGHCSFLVALEGFKVVPIFMELYKFLYAARKSPEEYVDFIRKAEGRITRWAKEWHPEFQNQPMDNHIGLTNSTILRYYALEFRLVLYHPSLSLTKSAQFNESNLRKCMEVTDEMLQNIQIMKKLRVMDGTWSNCAAYLLAMQTTIYGVSQLRAELTPDKMQKLRADMESWLDILGEAGKLVGSGLTLQHTMRYQVEAGLTQLEQYLARRTGSIKLESESSSQGHHVPERHHRGDENAGSPEYADNSTGCSTAYKGAQTIVQTPPLRQDAGAAGTAYGNMAPVQNLQRIQGYSGYHTPIDSYNYRPLSHQQSGPSQASRSPYGPAASFDTNPNQPGAIKMTNPVLSPTTVPSYHPQAAPTSAHHQHHQPSHGHSRTSLQSPASGTPDPSAAQVGPPMDASALYADDAGAFAADSWHMYTQALPQLQQQQVAPDTALMQQMGAAGHAETAAAEYGSPHPGQGLQERAQTWPGNVIYDPQTGGR